MPYSEGDREAQTPVEVLRETFEKLGWTIGNNLAIEYRWGMGELRTDGVSRCGGLRGRMALVAPKKIFCTDCGYNDAPIFSLVL
jgi:hypothetical protein